MVSFKLCSYSSSTFPLKGIHLSPTFANLPPHVHPRQLVALASALALLFPITVHTTLSSDYSDINLYLPWWNSILLAFYLGACLSALHA